ncbi:hypothetical protein ACIQM3_09265 [Streptomyces sp. NPDC091271]|uniref:hypothetical protein n=1 Tax=Streptomyces sp. NPDC091271 TaxID=3365980 RepID=UPI00380CC256
MTTNSTAAAGTAAFLSRTGSAPGASSTAFRPGAAGNRLLVALFDDCAACHRLVVGRAVRAYGISLPAYDVLATLREAGAPCRLTTGEVAAAGSARAAVSPSRPTGRRRPG